MARRSLTAFLIVWTCAAAPLQAVPPQSALAEAVKRRDTAGLRALLKQGADVNAAEGDGTTALHWAAMNGDVETTRMLLYAGANVKATTRLGGHTPLLMVSRLGNAAMMKTLIEGGADPNQPTTNGTTPLMLAAASGNVDAVALLLDRGAKIDAKENAMGETALMFAAAYGRTGVVQLLVARGADVKATGKVVDLFAYTKEAEDALAAAIGRRQLESQGTLDPQAAAKPAELKPAAEPAPAAKPKAVPTPKPAKAKASGKREPAAKSVAEAKPESNPEDANATDPSEPGTPAAEAKPAAAKPAAPAKPPEKPKVAGVDRGFFYNELVGYTGGLTPLHFAVRQGQIETIQALLDAGADVNQVTSGDKTSPLLMATVNGRFDVAKLLLEKGADPRLASENGVTPLYAAVNVQWAPKALYPQPRAYLQQKTSHLDLMAALLEKGADPNARLKKKVWYSGYNFDLSGVDESGATAFWRAAYGADVDAMRLLVAKGAEPKIRTLRPVGRPRTGDGQRDAKDVSGLPPVPVGGPGVTALQAAAGVGYGEGFAANSHRYAPGGMLAAVKYLVDELGMDVNEIDHEGNTALHHAAARGDNEMILYLTAKGANVMATNREGRTTADMANGPVQRVEPFPETIALLEKMGAKNNRKCVSCDNAVAAKTGSK